MMTGEADQSFGGAAAEVHGAGYLLERAMRKLEWLLGEDRWKTVGDGFDDVHVFLESLRLDNFKLIAEQRKKLVVLIKKAEPKIKNREIARALHIDHKTVAADVASGEPSPPKQKNSKKNNGEEKPSGDNSPSVELSGPAAAKAGAAIEARLLKEQKREASRAENREKVAHVVANDIPIDAKFPTIVIDPPWDWGDEGDQDQLGRARPDYATMTIEQLMDFNMVRDHAAADCHLYMWITNRSLPKGFALLERWGFRYVTMLTWVKPSFGMGNYFRGQTEQILFGVKGSQSLMRKDIGTAFHWPRGQSGHSSKPVEMYEMVEAASPGPYLEIFSRHERADWTSWGENSRAEAA